MSVVAAIIVIALWLPDLTSVGDVNLSAAFLIPIAAGLFSLDVKKSLASLPARRRTVLLVVLFTNLAIGALAILSFLWADIPFRVFRIAYGQIFGMIFLLFLVCQQDMKVWNTVFKTFSWCAVCISIVAIATHYIHPLHSITNNSGDRTAGFFKQSNQLGMILAMATPISISYFFSKNLRMSYIAIILAILFLGLSFSGSKTNLILASFSIIVLVFFLLLVYRIFTRAPLLAVLTLVIAVALPLLGYYALEFLNPRAHRLLTHFAENGDTASLDIRRLIWKQSIETGFSHPLGGVGAGQPVFGGRFLHSHNVFIDFFRTLGFPGLTLITLQIFSILILIIAEVKKALLQRKSLQIAFIAAAVSLGLFTYIASNQTSDSFGPSTLPLFWVALSLLLSATRVPSSRNEPVVRPTFQMATA